VEVPLKVRGLTEQERRGILSVDVPRQQAVRESDIFRATGRLYVRSEFKTPSADPIRTS
jgi:hypothetical protein